MPTIKRSDESLSLDERLGQVIRAKRAERGLSMEALAFMICTTYQQVQKYEKGENRVSFSTFVAIARALDVSPHDLLKETLTEDAAPKMPSLSKRAMKVLDSKSTAFCNALSQFLREIQEEIDFEVRLATGRGDAKTGEKS